MCKHLVCWDASVICVYNRYKPNICVNHVYTETHLLCMVVCLFAGLLDSFLRGWTSHATCFFPVNPVISRLGWLFKINPINGTIGYGISLGFHRSPSLVMLASQQVVPEGSETGLDWAESSWFNDFFDAECSGVLHIFSTYVHTFRCIFCVCLMNMHVNLYSFSSVSSMRDQQKCGNGFNCCFTSSSLGLWFWG